MRCGFWPLIHWYVYPWSSLSFPRERTARVSSRSITLTNKSTCLTQTGASSLVSTSPLAVTTVVGLLRTPYGFQFGRVKVFPADSMHACSGVHHKFSFLQFYCGCGRQNPLFGWRTECSFFFSLSLLIVLASLHASPRAHRSCLLSLLLRSVLKFHSVGIALVRGFDLYFVGRWTFVFLGCLQDAAQILWIVLVGLVPRLLCPSVKSWQIPAARSPAIHNPTVVHLSLLLLHFCHHPSSAFVGLFLNLPVRKWALCAAHIPILTCRTDIREDATSHKVI